MYNGFIVTGTTPGPNFKTIQSGLSLIQYISGEIYIFQIILSNVLKTEYIVYL